MERITPMARKEKITRAELKQLKKDRKIFRKELRTKGIKKRSEFESIAKEVGLGYAKESTRGALIGCYLNLASVWKYIAAGSTLYNILGALALLMSIAFVASFVTEYKGRFTINLTGDMISEGYVLSDTVGFEQESTRLYTTELTEVNAISVEDIDSEVDEIDGDHNGTGYMAYTFYIKNAGTESSNYTYELQITSETLDTMAATWVMIFVDGEQTMYAQLSEDGDGENLYGYKIMPFEELAQDSDTLYYEEDGLYGITPVPLISEEIVANGLQEDMEVGEVHKYTIVVWIEGDDPECTNDILGGHVGFSFQFEMVSEEEMDLFKGLYFESDY